MRGVYYHIHAYVNSIVNTLANQPFNESNFSVYGHYAIFYVIPVQILHAFLGISNLESIILAICLVGVITFTLSYYLLDKFIKNNAVYCVSVIAFTVISVFCYGSGQYYQVLPHRVLFQALALYGAWYSIYVKRKKLYLWIICICAVIWNIEVGLICCVAAFALNIWFDISNETKHCSAWLCIIKNFFLMVSEFMGAYVIVNIYNVCNGGSLNSIKLFISPMANQDYMLGALPTALPNVFAGYYLEIVLFMGAFCYCGSKLIYLKNEKDIDKNRYAFLIYNSLIGLGCLTYYMNRAARANLYISHSELIVLLALGADLETERLTFGYNNFSIGHIRRIIRLCSTFILMSLVLDSVGHVGIAIQNRMQAGWNTDSMAEICQAIQETVPEDIYGFGYGVPELYSALDRKTGVYVGDWSDYAMFDMSVIDNVMANKDCLFASKSSIEMSRNYVDFLCTQSYEINGITFGLYERNEMQPIDGEYTITSKLNSALKIYTDGNTVFLSNNDSLITLLDHTLAFDNDMALDVSYGIDAVGIIQVRERNNMDAQRWFFEEAEGYYMICWHGYALTYDLNDNSIKLMPIIGADSQLWQMNILE